MEESTFISFELTQLEHCDEVACGGLKTNHPDYLLPVIFDAHHGTKAVRYTVPENYKALAENVSELQIEQVLGLYDKILGMLADCEDCFLQPGAFCMEPAYVYVNEAYDQLKYLYIPEEQVSIDLQSIKYLMVSILEKCDETSGGKIQLQLYKYFYKPKFLLSELKEMLSQFKASIESSEDLQELSPVQNDFQKNKMTAYRSKKEEIDNQVQESRVKKLEPGGRSSYTPKVNRSQLSQDEIEEMVRSIYHKQEEKESVQENEDSMDEPRSGMEIMTEDVTKKVEQGEQEKSCKETRKHNLFDNVFSQGRNPVKTAASQSPDYHAILKSVSVHTRYDLPKRIDVQLIDNRFIIGRATRTGEPSGADYEFGSEVTPISLKHAQIEWQEGSYYLRDLGSNNGTFLNGNKIEPQQDYLIEDGDRIAFAVAFSKNSIEYLFTE